MSTFIVRCLFVGNVAMAGNMHFARSGKIDVTATTTELRVCAGDMDASIRVLSGVLKNKPVLGNVTSVARLKID